ncbi:hypothetical protein HYV85_06285 [Candidatus Woesearchaeota archaeon]|nr:hypothetical protein [Candidatus Woesearchaeota archaeon]
MISPAEADGSSSGRIGNEPLSAVLAKDSRLARELKSRISALGSSRDSCIRQLREINPKFKSTIIKVRELREARDKETAIVRELKAKRQEANESLKLISAELKKAVEAEEEAAEELAHRSHGKTVPKKKSVGQLISEIASIELKIETEVIPFEKEKQLMKVINEKKRQLESVKQFSEASKSHRELFAKFSDIRRQSNAFHKELQQHAAESQRLHEEMVKLIPQLRELRQRKKLLVEQLEKAKEDYAAANSSLGQTLHELSDVKERLDAMAAARKKEAEEKKEQELTEKLKSGKKLTAKDLIMLQGK